MYFHLLTAFLVNSTLGTSALLLLQNTNWLKFTLAQFVLCVLFFRCFTLFHDAAHGLVHPNQWINDSIGFLSSLFCFLPYWPWRLIHLEHHKWTGHIEKDPVLLILKTYPGLSASKKKFLNRVWKSWVPYLAYQQHVVFWKMGHLYFKKAERPSDKTKSVLSYAVLIAFYCALTAFLGPKIFLHSLPGVVLYLIAVEIINFPHHLSLNSKNDSRPTPPNKQFEFCRSCHHSYFFSYFILGNFNYHTEHHMFPFLPWYQLHKIKDDVSTSLQNAYNKSDGFRWIEQNRPKDLEIVMYGAKVSEPVQEEVLKTSA